MKVFVIEDEKVLLKVIKERLEKESFGVGFAHDGDTSLSEVRKFNPDLILLDLLLPKVSGLEVLASLKKDNNLKKIPVIILSNLSDSQNIKKALNMGAVDYMIKTEHPINEVVEKVSKYILKAR